MEPLNKAFFAPFYHESENNNSSDMILFSTGYTHSWHQIIPLWAKNKTKKNPSIIMKLHV